MNVEEILADWELNAGASDDEFNQATTALSVSLPSDYLQFIRKNDGGEGLLGDNYLILWRIGELSIFNKEYEVEKYAPGLLLFGSSGGGEGYGFDMRDPALPVVQVPFIGMDLRYAKPVADSFSDLLTQLAK